MKIASKCFRKSSSAEIVEELFEIAHIITKVNKSHNLGETLIKQWIEKVAGLVLGKTFYNYNTYWWACKRHGVSSSQKNYKLHLSISCDEQLILSKYCSCQSTLASIQEYMLFCKPQETTCRTEN